MMTKLHSTSDFNKNDFCVFIFRPNIRLDCVKSNGTDQFLTGTKNLMHLLNWVHDAARYSYSLSLDGYNQVFFSQHLQLLEKELT